MQIVFNLRVFRVGMIDIQVQITVVESVLYIVTPVEPPMWQTKKKKKETRILLSVPWVTKSSMIPTTVQTSLSQHLLVALIKEAT